MNNVDEKLVKSLFSQENKAKLDIDVDESKGGYFIIKPKQGGIVLKSINKAEFNIY